MQLQGGTCFRQTSNNIYILGRNTVLLFSSQAFKTALAKGCSMKHIQHIQKEFQLHPLAELSIRNFVSNAAFRMMHSCETGTHDYRSHWEYIPWGCFLVWERSRTVCRSLGLKICWLFLMGCQRMTTGFSGMK